MTVGLRLTSVLPSSRPPSISPPAAVITSDSGSVSISTEQSTTLPPVEVASELSIGVSKTVLFSCDRPVLFLLKLLGPKTRNNR